MRVPQAVNKSHCDELEYFQRKLCLKDNGANTEEVLFLLRHLERIRVDMLSAENFDDALAAYYSWRYDPKNEALMKKFGLVE